MCWFLGGCRIAVVCFPTAVSVVLGVFILLRLWWTLFFLHLSGRIGYYRWYCCSFMRHATFHLSLLPPVVVQPVVAAVGVVAALAVAGRPTPRNRAIVAA